MSKEMNKIKPKYRLAFAGDVKPDRAGVYVVTTDEPGHWGYFMGWFNGQYWYEYTRAHCSAGEAPIGKRVARLAVTAWAHINSEAFSAALAENQKAPTASAYAHQTRDEKAVVRESLVVVTP